MAGVHVYVHKPLQEDVSDLEDLEEAVGRLGFVSEVRTNPSGNVAAVSFDGGRAEQEEIERVMEEGSYEISRLSVRSDFSEGRAARRPSIRTGYARSACCR